VYRDWHLQTRAWTEAGWTRVQINDEYDRVDNVGQSLHSSAEIGAVRALEKEVVAAADVVDVADVAVAGAVPVVHDVLVVHAVVDLVAAVAVVAVVAVKVVVAGGVARSRRARVPTCERLTHC
jgi:hypothetical protein